MAGAPLEDDLYGLFVRDASLVHPVVGEGVVHIRNRHQSRADGNLIAAKTVGVAGPVPFFLMRERQLLRRSEKFNIPSERLLGV